VKYGRIGHPKQEEQYDSRNESRTGCKCRRPLYSNACRRQEFTQIGPNMGKCPIGSKTCSCKDSACADIAAPPSNPTRVHSNINAHPSRSRKLELGCQRPPSAAASHINGAEAAWLAASFRSAAANPAAATAAPVQKRGKKKIPGQKEMLLPILGKNRLPRRHGRLESRAAGSGKRPEGRFFLSVCASFSEFSEANN
jgi:hypothetical protein